MSRIDQIEEALVEFNHVSNLIKLFEKILENNASDSIYVKKTDGTDKDTGILPLLTLGEVELIQSTEDIKKMFESKWEYMELGSSQTDLVESYVLKTIKETLERELK